MPTPPMMKCGHAANATCDGKPSCAICAGLTPDALIVDASPPDLTLRAARCHYYGHRARGFGKCESNYGTKPNQPCDAQRPSSPGLPFFESRPSEEFDRFYCGCHGWD